MFLPHETTHPRAGTTSPVVLGPTWDLEPMCLADRGPGPTPQPSREEGLFLSSERHLGQCQPYAASSQVLGTSRLKDSVFVIYAYYPLEITQLEEKRGRVLSRTTEKEHPSLSAALGNFPSL